MLYLLDANVLIDANRDYYPITRVPEFWGWLLEMGKNGHVRIPIEVYEEIKEGTYREDEEDKDKVKFTDWAKNSETETVLLLNEEVDVALVAQIVDKGYAPDLTDDEVEKIGRDPFLVAYGLKDKNNRCLVTTEVSRPSKQRANRKLPDVCKDFGVSCCNTFKFTKELNFSTK